MRAWSGGSCYSFHPTHDTVHCIISRGIFALEFLEIRVINYKKTSNIQMEHEVIFE